MTYLNLLVSELYLSHDGIVSIPILNPNPFPVQPNYNTSLRKVCNVVEVHHTNYILCNKEKREYPKSKVHNFDINPDLASDQQHNLLQLLDEYRMVFATSETDIGTNPGPEKMIIDTEDSDPIKLPPYKKSHAERQIIRDYISKFLAAGIIEERSSDYASPSLLIRKKGNNWRICIDYRSSIM